MIFGLSFGCCYKFIKGKNRNEALTFYRENFGSDINAIEILIPDKLINKFEISAENYRWLNSLVYISYHITTDPKYFLDHHRVIKKLPYINSIICHIDCKNKLPGWMNEVYSSKLTYENIDTAIYNFEDIFTICFDTSHALKYGEEYFTKFLGNQEIKINQIHLSDNNKKCHEAFYKNPSNFDFVKKEIDLTYYPVILESVHKNKRSLIKEINFIKENL